MTVALLLGACYSTSTAPDTRGSQSSGNSLSQYDERVLALIRAIDSGRVMRGMSIEEVEKELAGGLVLMQDRWYGYSTLGAIELSPPFVPENPAYSAMSTGWGARLGFDANGRLVSCWMIPEEWERGIGPLPRVNPG
ncbi:MAG: hypothetical protein KF724_12950 [Phycisphaeraceae bacterium]|nr:hypothetical protein [Phycisphaeraceae bacterium]